MRILSSYGRIYSNEHVTFQLFDMFLSVILRRLRVMNEQIFFDGLIYNKIHMIMFVCGDPYYSFINIVLLFYHFSFIFNLILVIFILFPRQHQNCCQRYMTEYP